VNEQLANTENEFLWNLLANPADANHSYIFNLQLLVNDFPQSGALRALLMPNGDRQNLKHTAAYFDPVILHKLATAPDSLPAVTAGQLVLDDVTLPVTDDTYVTPPEAEPFVPPVEEEAIEYLPVTDDTLINDIELPINNYEEEADQSTHIRETGTDTVWEDHPEPADTIDEWKPTPANHYLRDVEIDHTNEAPSRQVPVADITPVQENAQVETSTVSEHEPITYTYPVQAGRVAEPAPLTVIDEPIPENKQETPRMPAEDENRLAMEYNEYVAKTNDSPDTETVDDIDDKVEYFHQDIGDKVEYFHQDIDDEVYDEIVSIEDIGLEQLAIFNKTVKDETVNTDTGINDNYFVFEPALTENVVESESPAVQPDTTVQSETPVQPGTTHKVSRYNDEKMPYSFMWWLDKTRKEHAEIYQPYVSNPKPITAKPATREVADELQQQYYEGIVSINSLDELGQTARTTSAPHPLRKADRIIERFIKEEPQIKHPGNVKLDNENKAKKSSEDRDELVTETLARIYTEQMLYHKAALTYKKLMLKYPEKSLYFAGQIEQLENKIN
jgi:hypothetical protein